MDNSRKNVNSNSSNTNNKGSSGRTLFYGAIRLNRRYPEGNTEYQFLYKAFGIIDNCIGLNLQKQLREAPDREGNIDLKEFSPLFALHTRQTGYFTGIRNVADLLDNASQRSDVRKQLEELKELAESIVASRVTDLLRRMRRNQERDVIVGHKAALLLWELFVVFIDWLITGRMGKEPEFIGKMATPMPVHFDCCSGESELIFYGYFNFGSAVEIKLFNPNEQPVVFRLIMDGIRYYSIEEDCGVIAQGSDVTATIELMPLHKWDERIRDKSADKLIIETMIKPNKRIPDESSLWEMFEVTNPRLVVRTEIRCALSLKDFPNNNKFIE